MPTGSTSVLGRMCGSGFPRKRRALVGASANSQPRRDGFEFDCRTRERTDERGPATVAGFAVNSATRAPCALGPDVPLSKARSVGHRRLRATTSPTALRRPFDRCSPHRGDGEDLGLVRTLKPRRFARPAPLEDRGPLGVVRCVPIARRPRMPPPTPRRGQGPRTRARDPGQSLRPSPPRNTRTRSGEDARNRLLMSGQTSGADQNDSERPTVARSVFPTRCARSSKRIPLRSDLSPDRLRLAEPRCFRPMRR